mmetsp:Transcript_9936/g.14389  ORF Transcript_9936/g.14389 Transcript_9936/m.14389 type:complete len:114 (-) Transcript_9936:9-350(-)
MYRIRDWKWRGEMRDNVIFEVPPPRRFFSFFGVLRVDGGFGWRWGPEFVTNFGAGLKVRKVLGRRACPKHGMSSMLELFEKRTDNVGLRAIGEDQSSERPLQRPSLILRLQRS